MRRPMVVNKYRSTEVRNEHGELGIAVELYRMGSGARVVCRAPGDSWVEQMQAVKDLNYGRVTVVMNCTMSPGYDDENGVVISLLPGKLTGDIGDGRLLRRGLRPIELPNFPDITGKDDVFTLETSLADGIALRDALSKIVREARRLTAQAKKQKEKRQAKQVATCS